MTDDRPELPSTAQALLGDFLLTLLAMDACQREEGQRTDTWRALCEHLGAVELALRASGEGRLGITALLTHPNRTVRAWAASYAMFWDRVPARAALVRLHHDDVTVG